MVAATRESFAFCQHPLQGKLDNYRFLAKNTHELIVLPVLRQVLLAKCFGLRRLTRFERRAVSQRPPLCRQEFLGKRYPPEPWPGSSNWVRWSADRPWHLNAYTCLIATAGPYTCLSGRDKFDQFCPRLVVCAEQEYMSRCGRRQGGLCAIRPVGILLVAVS
jgi:hypothetical protein